VSSLGVVSLCDAKCPGLLQRQVSLIASSKALKREKLNRRGRAHLEVILNNKMDRAIHLLQFERVVELAQMGGAIDHITSTGYTALGMAAASGSRAVDIEGKDVMAVELLLDRKEHRPKVDRVLPIGHTALTLAAKNGRDDVLEFLLLRGADLNLRYVRHHRCMA